MNKVEFIERLIEYTKSGELEWTRDSEGGYRYQGVKRSISIRAAGNEIEMELIEPKTMYPLINELSSISNLRSWPPPEWEPLVELYALITTLNGNFE